MSSGSCDAVPAPSCNHGPNGAQSCKTNWLTWEPCSKFRCIGCVCLRVPFAQRSALLCMRAYNADEFLRTMFRMKLGFGPTRLTREQRRWDATSIKHFVSRHMADVAKRKMKIHAHSPYLRVHAQTTNTHMRVPKAYPWLDAMAKGHGMRPCPDAWLEAMALPQLTNMAFGYVLYEASAYNSRIKAAPCLFDRRRNTHAYKRCKHLALVISMRRGRHIIIYIYI